MSKTPAPQTPPDDELGFFDGLPVVSTAVKVTNAGDGLSTAMKIEPEAFTIGQTVVLVIETVVTRVSHEPVSKDAPDVLKRVHVLRAGTVAVVERSEVDDILNAQQIVIEEAKGVTRLPFDLDDTNDLYANPEDTDETPLRSVPTAI